MTIEEFDKAKWTGGMKIIHTWEYDGKRNEDVRNVCSVDFIEKLIAFNIDNDEDLHWARCENCTIV